MQKALNESEMMKNDLFKLDKDKVPVRSYQTALTKNVMAPVKILEDIAMASGWAKPIYGASDYNASEGFLCSVAVRGKVAVAIWRDITPKLPQALAAAAFLHFLGFKINFNFYIHDVPDDSHCRTTVVVSEDKKLIKDLIIKVFATLTNDEIINNCTSFLKYTFKVLKNDTRLNTEATVFDMPESKSTISAVRDLDKKGISGLKVDELVKLEKDSQLALPQVKTAKVKVYQRFENSSSNTSLNKNHSDVKNPMSEQATVKERSMKTSVQSVPANQEVEKSDGGVLKGIEKQCNKYDSIVKRHMHEQNKDDEGRLKPTQYIPGNEDLGILGEDLQGNQYNDAAMRCYLSYKTQALEYMEYICKKLEKVVKED